ncbi:uncharacterized protein LOC107646973 [Arachis ipaensis]|uniref:uncharacterized protein LOC107646973 n=1 Tax=Arachis ipaensis TaxID=130454 RepID=UPI0007AF3C64|nr:uncharacterized protein LOC107646973 [Arachis ipaensis]XP_025661586.1 uncharacterized protein LOC112757190 [Arachis hypogaea]
MEMMAKRIDGLQVAAVNTTNQPPAGWGQNEEIYEEQQPEQVNYMHNQERQIGQLSKQPERPTNTFPSDTIPNPKEEYKAIQLRSGRTLENDKVGSKKEVASEEKNQGELKEKDEEPQASNKGKQVMEEHSQEQRKDAKPYTPPLPYPQRLQKELKDQQFPKFLEVFKKLEINIPLAEVLEQMPLYAKFLKELINKKKSWNKKETVFLTQECSAIIQKGLLPKFKDPGSFFLPSTIGNISIDKALCDLGSSINLMPLSMMRKLAIEEVKLIRMTLQLADRSMVVPNEVVENLLVKITLNVFKEMQHPDGENGCMQVEEEDLNWKEKPKEALINSPLKQKTDRGEEQTGNEDVKAEKGL